MKHLLLFKAWMMEPVNHIYKDIKKSVMQSPAWFGMGIFAVVLGIYFYGSIHPMLPYNNIDQFSYLFAQGFHHSFTSWENGVSFPPIQNIHLLGAAIFYALGLLPGSIFFYLWIAQTSLIFFFLTRIHRLLEMSLINNWKWIVWLLLLIHPGLWNHFLFSPTLILTTAIFLHALNLLQMESHPIEIGIWMFLLSFCGILGFVLGCLLLAFYGALYLYFLWRNSTFGNITAASLHFNSNPKNEAWMIHDQEKITQIHKKNISHNRLIPFLALCPSFLLYSSISLLWGHVGGPVLDGYPTLISNVKTLSLLNGYWTEQFLSIMEFWGNGMLSLPIIFPLAGFLFLLGMIYAWERYPERKEATFLLSFMLGASWLLFAFSPFNNIQSWSLVFFPFLLLYAVIGLIYIHQEIRFNTRSFLPVLIILLVITSVLRWPFEFHQIMKETRYNSLVLSNILRAKDWHGQENQTAVRFSPEIFTALLGKSNNTPAGLQVRVGGKTREGYRGGKELTENTNNNRFFLYYSTYDEALKKYDYSNEAPWNQWIEDATSPITMQNVKIYPSRKKNDGVFPLKNFVQREMKEKVQPVGTAWTFENSKTNLDQTGIALTPGTDQQRMEGFASAGPGHDLNGDELGWLQSKPFTIVGDDFFLSAKLPGDATSSLICLAVYQSSPIGKNENVEQARHIFEYRSNEPLADKTFYYVNPRKLEYIEGNPRTIRGWRVVRLHHGKKEDHWKSLRWSLDPWKNHQAMWFAADRNSQQEVRIDALTQVQRAPGYYWNFEDGTYSPWTIRGTAFGNTPAKSRYGDQNPIHGQEGNYFVNSFHQGSDLAQGRLVSPNFTIKGRTLRFRVGGGEYQERTYVALVIDDVIVKKASGERTERMRTVEWDLSPWEGQKAHLEIVDQSSSAWGHILADDFRLTY